MEPSKFRMTPNQIYKTRTLQKAYQLLVILACHLYGQESIDTFPQSLDVMLNWLASEGKPFNQSNMLALQLKFHVSNAQNPPNAQQEILFMSSYLLHAVYTHQQFLGMGWAWTHLDNGMNVYFKFLSKWSYQGVMARIPDHIISSLYMMMFEQDSCIMSQVARDVFWNIGNWYASPNGTFIGMYNAEKDLHLLPKFAKNRVVMQEVAYHILIRLLARLHRKKKEPWPMLHLQIALYAIQSLKEADVKVNDLKKFKFGTNNFKLYDLHGL